MKFYCLALKGNRTEFVQIDCYVTLAAHSDYGRGSCSLLLSARLKVASQVWYKSLNSCSGNDDMSMKSNCSRRLKSSMNSYCTYATDWKCFLMLKSFSLPSNPSGGKLCITIFQRRKVPIHCSWKLSLFPEATTNFPGTL